MAANTDITSESIVAVDRALDWLARNQNKDGKVGIKLYARGKDGKWTTHLIDDNKMACEDFKVVDLNKDGKLDIVACGRATRNVVIYWNK